MSAATIALCWRRLVVSPAGDGPVAGALRSAGQRVTIIADGRADLASYGLIWIQGNANWFPQLCRQLAAVPRSRRPPTLVWHTEPLPPSRASGLPRPGLNTREIAKIILRDVRATDPYSNWWRLRRLASAGVPDLLVTSADGRREFLAEHGLSACRVPLGYDTSYGDDLQAARDIDVLFLGAPEIPRHASAVKYLRRRGVELTAVGSWSSPAYWGDNRTRLLNRTRILLNLLRRPGEFSGLRLVLGMANGALVVSEPMYRPNPFVPGVHYAEATLGEMPGVLHHYLTHEAERKRLAASGHRFVTEELTMAASVERILTLVRERTHALV